MPNQAVTKCKHVVTWKSPFPQEGPCSGINKGCVAVCLMFLFLFTAPPQLINVFNIPHQCNPPVARNSCVTSGVTYKPTVEFSVVVKYFSVDQATVRWFHNETEINCLNSMQSCVKIDTKPGVSFLTILLVAFG